MGVARFETHVQGLVSQECSVGGARFETQVRGLALQEELLAAMADAHVKQCTITHSAWEKAQAQVWNRMGELLVEMADVCLEWDNIIYSAAISACVKASKWSRVVALLAQLETNFVVRYTFTYHAAISACGTGGYAGGVQGLLAALAEARVRALGLLAELADVCTKQYNITYSAAMELGDAWSQAVELLALPWVRVEQSPPSFKVPFILMAGLRVKRHTVKYNAALSACEKAQFRSRQWELLAALAAGVRQRQQLLQRCEKGGLWQQQGHRRLQPCGHAQRTIIKYNAAVRACVKAGCCGCFSRSIRVVSHGVQQLQRQLRPFQQLQRTFLLRLLQQRSFQRRPRPFQQQPRRPWRRLQQQQLQQQQQQIAHGTGGELHRAEGLLASMAEAHAELGIITYSSAAVGDRLRAKELRARMGVAHLEHDNISYSAAISACEKACSWPRGLRLLAMMADGHGVQYILGSAGAQQRELQQHCAQGAYSSSWGIGAYCRGGGSCGGQQSTQCGGQRSGSGRCRGSGTVQRPACARWADYCGTSSFMVLGPAVARKAVLGRSAAITACNACVECGQWLEAMAVLSRGLPGAAPLHGVSWCRDSWAAWWVGSGGGHCRVQRGCCVSGALGAAAVLAAAALVAELLWASAALVCTCRAGAEGSHSATAHGRFAVASPLGPCARAGTHGAGAPPLECGAPPLHEGLCRAGARPMP